MAGECSDLETKLDDCARHSGDASGHLATMTTGNTTNGADEVCSEAQGASQKEKEIIKTLKRLQRSVSKLKRRGRMVSGSSTDAESQQSGKASSSSYERASPCKKRKIKINTKNTKNKEKIRKLKLKKIDTPHTPYVIKDKVDFTTEQLSSANDNEMQLSTANKRQLRSAKMRQLRSATNTSNDNANNNNINKNKNLTEQHHDINMPENEYANEHSDNSIADDAKINDIYNSISLHPSDEGELLNEFNVTAEATVDPLATCNVADDVAEQEDVYQGLELPYPVEIQGAPIRQTMAGLINETWNKQYYHKQLLPIYAKYAIPSNIAETVVAPEMNSEVFSLLDRWQTKADLRQMGMQKSLTKVLSMSLRQNEIIAQSACDSSLKTESRQMCVDSAAMISHLNRDISLKRRSFVRSVLAPQYQKLSHPSRPITKKLFGDNLAEDIKDLNVMNRLSYKTVNPIHSTHTNTNTVNRNSAFIPHLNRQRNQPFLPRGRGNNHRPRNNYNNRGANTNNNNRNPPNYAYRNSKKFY